MADPLIRFVLMRDGEPISRHETLEATSRHARHEGITCRAEIRVLNPKEGEYTIWRLEPVLKTWHGTRPHNRDYDHEYRRLR